MTRYPVALTHADMDVLAGALAIRHGLLGCQGCRERTLELIAEWGALEGPDLEAAREHATDLAQRLGAVVGEHSGGES